jgi:diaminopimelate decarboxylase
MEDMEKLIILAKSLTNVKFRGLHFHIGSQILEMDDFIALAERINEIQDRLENEDINIEIINVGGGLGIDYQNPNGNPIPNFKAYFQTYQQHLKLRPGQSLHFELGRAVVGQCGSLITKVLYVKQGSFKKFAIVDAGFTELIRPALYHAHHKIENISATKNIRLTDKLAEVESEETYDVVGQICESSDVFDKGIQLPTTRRGDLLAIRSAGAYGEIMASQYNCRRLPEAYTIEEIEQG